MNTPEKFISTKEKTFQYDDNLPSLPVPPLDHTLARYLDSVKPHLSSEEFEKTRKIVEAFGEGEGRELHAQLLERSRHQRNWLEKWWTDIGYCTARTPISPLMNFGGPGPYYWHVWPPQENTQLERAALYLYSSMKIWQLLRRQNWPVDRSGSTVWSMDQFRRIFSTCRIPHDPVDYIDVHFRTEDEGPAPSHCIVICRGNFFELPLIDSKGEIYTAPEIESRLIDIKERSQNYGPALCALTAHKRDVWAKTRQHLISLHPDNKRHLESIEKSVLIVSLEDSRPSTYEEICVDSLCGDCTNRWFDKSFDISIHANGTVSCNCDHTPYEAMVMIIATNFIETFLKGCNGKWQGTLTKRNLPPARKLDFHLDNKVIAHVNEARQLYATNIAKVEIISPMYGKYGKNFAKEIRIHPDSYVQLTLQFAYYRLHNKPAPTYETASTRKFYNGRTETVRSCTTEVITWAKAMLNPASSREEKERLLRTAADRHIQLMTQAQDNFGCDRHLLGLYLIAQELGRKTPMLYDDPAYTRSGGGGNYILSTSFVGYTDMHGGVYPMTEHGYGCFYSIQENCMRFFVARYKASKQTNAQAFFGAICQSLDDMRQVLRQPPSKI